MDMMQKYPRISDMVRPAERRLPKFVHAYLAAGTGIGQAMHKNEQALSEIELMPRFLRGRVAPDTSCSLFGQAYAAPFGIAPVGLQSLIWPKGGEITGKSSSRSQDSLYLEHRCRRRSGNHRPYRRRYGLVSTLYPQRQGGDARFAGTRESGRL